MAENRQISRGKRRKTVMLALLAAVFLILVLLPFLPGLVELARPQDASCLWINMNYSKDPRYFGRSFRTIMKKALESVEIQDGRITLNLSKREEAEIATKKSVPAHAVIDRILYVSGDFSSGEQASFAKEIYVEGETSVGEENSLRALAADGKISLGRETRVIRWVDAEANISVAQECDLGWSISSEGKLDIGRNCRFRRLFGMPITTGRKKTEFRAGGEEAVIDEISDTALISAPDWLIIPPETRIGRVIISRQNLLVKSHGIIKGDVKTHGRLILEDGVKITGNVFAEKDISLGRQVMVSGNIFSQGSIRIGENVTVGRAGTMKSVVGRKGITLARGIRIYGYVLSERKGKTR